MISLVARHPQGERQANVAHAAVSSKTRGVARAGPSVPGGTRADTTRLSLAFRALRL